MVLAKSGIPNLSSLICKIISTNPTLPYRVGDNCTFLAVIGIILATE